jgi:ferredoxin
MRLIELDGGEWKAPVDFLRSLAAAIGSPEWHGMSPDAFVDSMIWGGINSVQPPYTVQINNITDAPSEVVEFVSLMARVIEEARQERFRQRGDNIEINITAEPVWKKVVQLVAASACPKCGNQAFDPEPGTGRNDPQGMVRCGKCGYVCPVDEFMKPVDRADKKSAN